MWYQEDYVRELKEECKKRIDAADYLLNKSIAVIEDENSLRPLFAFIFKEEKYYFALYYKYPDHKRLFVSDLYNEYDKCQHDASEYLRYYALFIFSSRNEC